MASDPLSDSPQTASILEDIVNRLIDSCILDDLLVMHRAIKLGYFHLLAPESISDLGDAELPTGIKPGSVPTGAVNSRENSSKSASCCRCVKCHSKVAATRFAPHLSNCMGLGRNSSRRANKRIAEQQKLEDYDDDADDDYLQDNMTASSNSIHSSNSDSALSRVTGSAVNKQPYSPLKMTISLVASKNTVESSAAAKHVVRSLNGTPVCSKPSQFTCLAVQSDDDLKLSVDSAKTNLSNPVVVLKDASVTLKPNTSNYGF